MASAPGGTPPEQLDSMDAGQRWRAAKALAGERGNAPVLVSRLSLETDENVRSALFSGLVGIGGEAVAGPIAALLRSGDPGLRGGAVEALQQLGEAAEPVVDALLGDAETDLRLLAIEVTRAWPAEVAAARLLRVIEDDAHVNVCAAAVDVAAELGTPALLGALARLRLRFAREPFLGFSVEVARARIGASDRRLP